MRLVHPIRCCHRMCNVTREQGARPALLSGRHNYGFLQIGNRHKTTGDGCCKDIDQSENKNVENWPCGTGCQYPPPNYDPYHIKTPDIAVPPLPPSNAKPMINCANPGRCCLKLHVPPPCPPPPPKPFNWLPLILVTLFFAIMGAIYKVYLCLDKKAESSVDKLVWRPRRIVKVPNNYRDLPECVQYLIVGAGAAGWAAHRAILKHDPTARIMFITKEDTLPYELPPMSKHMWWNKYPPDMETLNYFDKTFQSMYFTDCRYYVEPKKFAKLRKGPAISVCKGWFVKRLDAEEHRVWIHTLDGDRPMYYERCILATGSSPKKLNLFETAPKLVRDKVCYLRTVRDLEVAYRAVREARHVTIVGGGVLGSELAWYLGRRNMVKAANGEFEESPKLELTQVMASKGILPKVLPDYLGEWAAEKIRCEGVEIIQNAQVYDAFPTPDKRVELTLSNGDSLHTDYVFVCVGHKPRTKIAEESELEVDAELGGFKANTEMRVRKHLFAAGDAVSFFTSWSRRRVRSEHIMNAFETGEIAGANATGHWEPNNIVPHWRFQFEDELLCEVVGHTDTCDTTIGLFAPCAPEGSLKHDADVEERPCYADKDEYKARYKRGLIFYADEEGIIEGIVFWNTPYETDRVRVAAEILRARVSYKEVPLLAEHLNFEGIECLNADEARLAPPAQCITAGKDYELTGITCAPSKEETEIATESAVAKE